MTTARLHIKAKIEQLPLLYSFCEEHEIDNKILLALEEAIVNIASYSGASYIDLTYENREDAKIFIIEDDGKQFDPTAFTPNDGNAEELIDGGQGLRIIRKMIDSWHFQRTDNKNILSLIKNKAQQ